jgi:hypothetical protein
VIGTPSCQRAISRSVKTRFDRPGRDRVALGDEGIEAVEGAARAAAQRAALRRIRVNVVEVGEVLGVFGFAVHRDGVGALDFAVAALDGRERRARPERRGYDHRRDRRVSEYASCHGGHYNRPGEVGQVFDY